MADYYYYEVDYDCICEVCGEKIHGKMRRGPLEYNGGILTTGMAQLADAADMVLSKKLIQSAVDGTGNQPYVAENGDKCPNCGARQSWYPLSAPKKETGIGCLLLLAVFGTLLGLLIWAIFFIDYDFIGPLLMAVGLAIGIFFGVRIKIKNKAKDEKRYNEKLKEYEDFMESMKTRNVLNKPVIHWETAWRNRII